MTIYLFAIVIISIIIIIITMLALSILHLDTLFHTQKGRCSGEWR